ncbi:hypothetical protein DOCECA_03885 [Pseudomonas sp. E102]
MELLAEQAHKSRKKGTDLFSEPVMMGGDPDLVDRVGGKRRWENKSVPFFLRSRVGNGPDSEWLDVDPCFVALGATALERRRRYEAFVCEAIPAEQVRLIRDALQRGQLTETGRFVDEVERIVGIRIEQRGQGRPRGEQKNKSVPFLCSDGPRFVREVDVGKNIGTDKFNDFSSTTKMSVLTDEAGNLVSAFPGVLK